jgi:hypothetical protein
VCSSPRIRRSRTQRLRGTTVCWSSWQSRDATEARKLTHGRSTESTAPLVRAHPLDLPAFVRVRRAGRSRASSQPGPHARASRSDQPSDSTAFPRLLHVFPHNFTRGRVRRSIRPAVSGMRFPSGSRRQAMANVRIKVERVADRVALQPAPPPPPTHHLCGASSRVRRHVEASARRSSTVHTIAS